MLTWIIATIAAAAAAVAAAVASDAVGGTHVVVLFRARPAACIHLQPPEAEEHGEHVDGQTGTDAGTALDSCLVWAPERVDKGLDG